MSRGLCDDDDDDYLCAQCNGSGEGQHEGTRCLKCGGGGTERQDIEPDPDGWKQQRDCED